MWNLAYRLAHCGEHRNYQAIEWELQAYGYPQARQLLYHARVRERLDAICAEAQRSPTRLSILTASLRAFTIISTWPAQLKNNGASYRTVQKGESLWLFSKAPTQTEI